MKFYVRQNEIQNALNIIKSSKALGKQDEELFSTIKIEVSKKNDIRLCGSYKDSKYQ